MGLQRRVYYRSDLLSVRYVSCRNADKGFSDVEVSDGNTLIFPLRGVFLEHFSRRHELLAEPNSALLLPARSHSRVSHPVSTDDDCLVIEFSSGRVNFPASATHTLLSPVAITVRSLMHHRIRNRLSNGLEIEETAIELFFHALRNLNPMQIESGRNIKTLHHIDAARLILISHPERNWGLSSLAQNLGCSPFHLTRAFRQYIGVSLHRYQTYIRLNRSIELVLDGCDLTTIAHQLGFSSHSHFTAAFRQYVGFAPSRIREAASSKFASETRKNLIAAIA